MPRALRLVEAPAPGGRRRGHRRLGLTVLPGLIDCHDHLAFHGYELAARST
jgi:hypothetical protein